MHSTESEDGWIDGKGRVKDKCKESERDGCMESERDGLMERK